MFLFVNINVTLFHADMYFYVRQHVCYSAYMVAYGNSAHLSVCLFVRLLHALILSKRLNIEILSLSDRPMILVFDTKGCCVYLTVSPLTGAPNTTGE